MKLGVLPVSDGGGGVGVGNGGIKAFPVNKIFQALLLTVRGDVEICQVGGEMCCDLFYT